MLHSLEIIENIQTTQLNWGKNSFGRLSKWHSQVDSSGTQDQLGARII